jgi:hypothetical protein
MWGTPCRGELKEGCGGSWFRSRLATNRRCGYSKSNQIEHYLGARVTASCIPEVWAMRDIFGELLQLIPLG